MKRLLSLFCLSVVLFQNCQDETPIIKTGELAFSFNDIAGGRVKEVLVPAYVLLSIKDSHGNFIQQDKKLTLYDFGNGYVTESLQLPIGGYQLTEFIILDASNKAIYATPLEGSPMAQYVNDPLPINFSITENGSTLVKPQVLAVTDIVTPDQFGYGYFGFEVATTLFAVKGYKAEGVSDSVSYTYFNGKLSNSYSYSFPGGIPTLDKHMTLTYDALGQLSLIDEEYNPNLILLSSFEYGSGLITKYKSPNSQEVEFFYESGKLSYSVQRDLYPNDVAKDYSLQEYTLDSSNLVTQIKWYQIYPSKKLIALTEFHYDDKINPFKAAPCTYSHNIWIPFAQSHNVTRVTTTDYTKDPISVVETTYTYEYNANHVPTKRTTKSSGGISLEMLKDCTVVEYFYKKF